MSSTEFSGILSGQANLQSQLDKIRTPAAARKINKIIDNNTNIVKGAGTPIKSEVDYQEVMKVRESDVQLKRLGNSINSLSDSLNEVTNVSNSFGEARENLLQIKEIVGDALNNNLGNFAEKEAQQAKLIDLVQDLGGIAKIRH